MTVEEAQIKWCHTHAIKNVTQITAWHGGGLTRRLKLKAIAV